MQAIKNQLSIGFFILCISGFTSFSSFAEIKSEAAFTPELLLQNAIKAGQLDDVRTIVSAGTDVNMQMSDGVTPLHMAVINNQENIAAVLIQAGAKVNATDTTTLATPLHLAALYGREELAKMLIQKGANVNASMRFGITPLLVAAQFGQPQIVQLLLDKKANINVADQEGFTALHFAAQNGDEVLAKMLIENGANINLQDKTNKATPLGVALENNQTNVAQLLKNNHAN